MSIQKNQEYLALRLDGFRSTDGEYFPDFIHKDVEKYEGIAKFMKILRSSKQTQKFSSQIAKYKIQQGTYALSNLDIMDIAQKFNIELNDAKKYSQANNNKLKIGKILTRHDLKAIDMKSDQIDNLELPCQTMSQENTKK